MNDTQKRINDLEIEIARLRDERPTIRDQFAMAALPSIGAFSSERKVEIAYEIADLMMAERRKKE